MCSQFSMSYAVFRWLFIFCWVKFVLCRPFGCISASLVSLILMVSVSPISSLLSRHHEFQADAFAAQHADGQALAQALLKLYQDNACTLTPDPAYVAFYHSHPPASQRLARLIATA